MRGFVLVVLLVIASSPVSAGEFDTSSEVTSSGTRFTATWSQGCADTTYSGIPLDGAGPNTCAPVRPLYCPIDSTGTGASWETNCDTCSCYPGSACSLDGTECEECPDWCSRNCPTHKECIQGSYGDACTPIGFDCRYKWLDVFIDMRYATGTRYYWMDFQFMDSAPVGGPRQRIVFDGAGINIPRYFGCFCPKKDMVGVYEYWITADGEFRSRYYQDGPYDPNIKLYEDNSRIANAYVDYRCWWKLGGRSDDDATLQVDDGESTNFSVDCTSAIGTTHGGDVRLRRSSTGVLTCDVINEWGSAGGLDINRCIG